MKTQVGERDVICLQDDTEVEVVVREVIEEDDAFAITYMVPEWSSEEHEYITQPYHYQKRIDYSGIEKNTGMPRDYANKTLQDFNWAVYRQGMEGSQKIVSDFMFRFDEFLRQNLGLYIFSKTKGSGKTLLSCCIGNEIIRKRGLNVKFCNIADYIQLARNREADDMRNATVLILDDIGAQDESHEWIQELTFGLINYRYEKQKMTIFTSNLDVDHCSKDDRIISRVDSMTLPIKIPEVPVRRELSDARKQTFLRSLNERQ